jgi:gliding motility-associated lipoprotein GldB
MKLPYFSVRSSIIIGALLLLYCCNSPSETESAIAAVPVDFEIVRFDKAFAKATPDDLPNLKQRFPDFFPVQYPDSIWVAKLNDTLQDQLEAEVMRTFPSEEDIREPLHSLFQHIQYYIPNFSPPTVITTTSDVDYRNPVILADSLLIISLDTYLGAQHPFYVDMPAYLSKNRVPEQLPQEVASAYARRYIARPRQRSLLAQMIYFGKELYLKDLWLPNTTPAQRIGYAEEELKWAEENEVEMWRYFVENEMLYSTDAKLLPRFISPAPFSKFYLEIDNDSPGMIGRYLGWQIVRAYMDAQEVTVTELLQTRAEEVFSNSKYKPAK